MHINNYIITCTECGDKRYCVYGNTDKVIKYYKDKEWSILYYKDYGLLPIELKGICPDCKKHIDILGSD